MNIKQPKDLTMTTNRRPPETRPTTARRDRLHAELALLDAIDAVAPELEPGEYRGSHWEYRESTELAEAPDDLRRETALAWLARYARAFRRVQRELDQTFTVVKEADYREFGVSARIDIGGSMLWLVAKVPAALTCEMVDTGRVEHVEAHDVPIMERRCPESIFAGIADQVVAEVTA